MFYMQLFTSACISRGMSTTTTAITAASFEKIFVRNWAASVVHLQRHSYLVAEEEYHDLAAWREIAWKALEKKRLGDLLRRAIVVLPKQYRQVLFLRDVKNLDTAETAWILNITAGAVRARLLRARTQVCDTLTSSLLTRARDNSLVNSYRLFGGTKLEPVAIR
jgi:RNA polymerase sigma factor (sigma-70 family)